MNSSEGFRTRRFDSVPADQRPVRRRRAVRVVVTDGSRVLLFADTDPGIPGSRWWVTPGGGMDPGETLHETAVREVEEETGLRLTAADLLGPVSTRLVVHGYSDQVLAQTEAFFVARVPAPFALDVSGFTEDEQLTIADWSWHPLDALDELSEPVWPAYLPDLVARAGLTGPPQHRGVEEESVLAAGVLLDRATNEAG